MCDPSYENITVVKKQKLNCT